MACGSCALTAFGDVLMMCIDAEAGIHPAIDPLLEEMPAAECEILARARFRVVIWAGQFDKLAAANRLKRKGLLTEGPIHVHGIEFQPTEHGYAARKDLLRLGYSS